MNGIFLKIRNFMSGRNGIDKLSIGLIVVYCVFAAVKIFVRGIMPAYIVITVIQLLLLAYIVFRVFSRNIQKRYKENFKFEQFLNAWKPYFNHLKMRVTFFKTHRFRTCKHCGEFLRLKKGRGKRVVTCPKCGETLTFHFLF